MRNIAPLPLDEDRRLAVLATRGLMGSPADPELDQITRLAAEFMDMPICLVSIVGKEEQWLKSRWGLDVQRTPRDVAFCAHTIIGDDPLVVPDASRDPRFRQNPMVTGKEHIRFYAGAPVVTAEGAHVGALCVLDREPHESFAHEDTLVRMAAIIAGRLDAQYLKARDGSLHDGAAIPPGTGELPVGGPSPGRRASAIIAGRARLAHQFTPDLFSDPAFDILLALFAAEEDGMAMNVKSCRLAARVPATTALRWIGLMAKRGLIVQRPHPLDRRQVRLTLTPEASARIRAWIVSETVDVLPVRSGERATH